MNDACAPAAGRPPADCRAGEPFPCRCLVEKGQGLVIVEAMKMENEVRSPIAGEVKDIKVKQGDTVEGGAALLIVE
jgi:hypothetical protein